MSACDHWQDYDTTSDGMSRDPVHIYRALFRECTYLPDPNSQIFIRSWVRESFRKYLPRDLHYPRCKPEDITPEREQKVLRRARHIEYTLRRANEGYLVSFEKVMKWTYARSGKRRRLLLSDLTGQEPTESELQERGVSKLRKFSNEWEVPATIKALMSSHLHEAAHLSWQGRRPKPKGPQIPEKNIWGKPMPECRSRNMRHDWYARELQLILPPLPESEYNEIKAYATGEKKFHVKTRRPLASVPVFLVSQVEGRSALTEPSMAVRWNSKQRQKPHKLTNRYLRRQMQRLLVHVPVVAASKDESSARLAVKWDRVEKNHWTISGTTGEPSQGAFRLSHQLQAS